MIEKIVNKLEEFGYKTKHDDCHIRLIQEETNLYGSIALLPDSFICLLTVGMAGDEAEILSFEHFDYSKVDEVLSIYEKVVCKIKRIKKSSDAFYNSVPSLGKLVTNIDLFEKYLVHFKHYVGTHTGNLLELIGVFYKLNIYLSANFELTVTLCGDGFRELIYSNILTEENHERTFSEVDNLIEEFNKSCGTYKDIINMRK